jgi:hypothetical protein
MGEKENSPPSKGTQAMKETTMGAESQQAEQADSPTWLNVLEMLALCEDADKLTVWRFFKSDPRPDEAEELRARAEALIASPDEESRATGYRLLAMFGGGE